MTLVVLFFLVTSFYFLFSSPDLLSFSLVSFGVCVWLCLLSKHLVFPSLHLMFLSSCAFFVCCVCVYVFSQDLFSGYDFYYLGDF